MAKKRKASRRERSAITGRYVPKGTEKKRPRTTVTERIKKKRGK